MQNFWNKESEISRLLHEYFDAEDCSLIGDTVVDNKEAKEVGRLVSASFTGKDLILQMKFIVKRDKKGNTYNDQIVIVNKDDIGE